LSFRVAGRISEASKETEAFFIFSEPHVSERLNLGERFVEKEKTISGKIARTINPDMKMVVLE
jgi:hypothetical protein